MPDLLQPFPFASAMHFPISSFLAPLLALAILPASFGAEPTKPADNTSGGQHQGGSRGWGFHRITDAAADPAFPHVLLVGDSIANGYHAEVARRLKDKANLDLFITPKHIAAPDYGAALTAALKHGPYAVIHFNESGLHAWVKGRIPEGQYGPLFAKAVATLRTGSPGAKLIWVSNTPATVAGKPGVIDAELDKTITDMNTAARAVAEKEGLPIDDLHALMSDKLNLAAGDRWHWTPEGTAVQAEAVAAAILRELEKSPIPAAPRKAAE